MFGVSSRPISNRMSKDQIKDPFSCQGSIVNINSKAMSYENCFQQEAVKTGVLSDLLSIPGDTRNQNDFNGGDNVLLRETAQLGGAQRCTKATQKSDSSKQSDVKKGLKIIQKLSHR